MPCCQLCDISCLASAHMGFGHIKSAYLASMLRTYAQILAAARTLGTRKTLSEIMSEENVLNTQRFG